jgi:sterol desaturase/sphingolipid hydroxylase (fatty acid hydroxylase superfamily)
MTDTVVVFALLAVVMALALPVVMIGFSRLPRMDREGDDFGAKDEPLLGWPPKAEDHAQAKRLMRVLLMWLVAFVLLLFALLISLGYIELPRWFEPSG